MIRQIVSLIALTALFACSGDSSPDKPGPGGDGRSDQGPGTEPAFEPNDNLVDRMGRAEVNNFLVRLPVSKPDYNESDSFELNLLQRGAFHTLIRTAIKFWDGLDDKTDWGLSDRGELADMYVHDFLIVDTSIPCGVSDRTYMDIELAPVGAHTTCGGRTPNIDSIDELVSLLIGGPDLSELRFGDGIDESTGKATDEFPYLAAPFRPQP